MAMERVLKCVELLDMILASGDMDGRTLAHCARVCKLWFTTATSNIWRSLENIEVLFRLLPLVVKRGETGQIVHVRL